ncbi:MAG: hypothetical protein WCL25_02295 [bacterium]
MKKVKTSSKGRICRYPHCKHILSIYNHEDYCHVHLDRLVQEYNPKVGK